MFLSFVGYIAVEVLYNVKGLLPGVLDLSGDWNDYCNDE
jgi:hypothetical protein